VSQPVSESAARVDHKLRDASSDQDTQAPSHGTAQAAEPKSNQGMLLFIH
jgi:hypothetical protein